MAVIAIPRAIRDVLGDEGSFALVDIFDKVVEDKKLGILEFVEEKFEKRLSEENAKTNGRITEDLAKLDKRITEEIAKLEVKMSQMETKLIKWMFIFWIGQFAAIVGTLTAILFAFFER